MASNQDETVGYKYAKCPMLNRLILDYTSITIMLSILLQETSLNGRVIDINSTPLTPLP